MGGRLTLPELETLMMRVADIGTWIVAQLETARQEPSEDILGAIARAMEADVLDVGEACIILQTLLSAGGESTTSLLGNSVRLLAEHQDVQSTLREQPDLIPVFVEEALRLESPFRFLFRSTAKDTQLGDVPIPAGSTVLLFWVPPIGTRRHSRIPIPSTCIVGCPVATSPSVVASTTAWVLPWPGSKDRSCSNACWSARVRSNSTPIGRPGGSTACRYAATSICLLRLPRHDQRRLRQHPSSRHGRAR